MVLRNGRRRTGSSGCEADYGSVDSTRNDREYSIKRVYVRTEIKVV